MRCFVKPRRSSIFGKPVLYRGFKITIINNRAYSFKYEWKIEAVSKTAKALLLRNYKRAGSLVMYDPTSDLHPTSAMDRALMKVNEIRSPFWYREWHRQ